MSELIRVLHVCHDLVGGGAEKQLRLLTAASRAHGMEPAIFCVNTGGLTEADTKCPIYRFDRRRKLDLRIFSHARQAVREFRPDLIHAWLPPVVTIPALVAAGLSRLPCVFSYRNAMFFETALQVPELMLVLAFANKIVANNPIEQSRPVFRWAYRRKHGEQIDNAIEPPALTISRARAPGERRVILFAGRIAPQKNWRCLIEGFAQLRRTENCELVICGVGEESEQLAAVVKGLSLDRDVRVLGYRDDLPDLMSRSDVFVLPSLYEGSANVVLEACAAGLPLVLSDIAPHRPFADAGAAVTFDPRNPSALADALARLKREPGLAARMTQNAGRIIAHRRPDEMAAAYARAYADSISRHRGR